MYIKLLTKHHWVYKEAAQARLSQCLSKCHIVGKHMSRLNYYITGTLAQRTSLPQCGTYPAVLSWNRTQPAGFFYRKIWHSDICRSPRYVDYNKCLRNNSLLLIGDSTMRQWYSFLERNLSCSRITEKWTIPIWHKMTMCSKSSLNLKIQWIPHSQPCFGEIWMANGKSVSAVMDAIPNNTQVVLVFGNFNHLIRYHHSVFQIRMRKISNSARRLLQRNPNTKIFIKGPHTFNNKRNIDLDYHGYLFKHIIYEEFKDLHDKVFFLDQTDMTIAKALQSVHPNEDIIRASVYQMLGFICTPTKP